LAEGRREEEEEEGKGEKEVAFRHIYIIVVD